MLGQDTSEKRSHVGRNSIVDDLLQNENSTTTDAECELCESTTVTQREYGIRVCQSCKRTYLP
ncbi:hypothetical protein [Halorussus sp. AFM4]|uniref:hypothetical protein n=1 Tax=Halorussus sp. AFM4 TaxID=3421651 RepID=UPI003EBEFAAC